MTNPFRPQLQRVHEGAEFSRFRTNAEILDAWKRDAATRLSDITVLHRDIEIRRFLEQWGTILVTDLSVADLRSYIEVYSSGCRNFRRGGLTRGKGRFVLEDRCAKAFDLAGCGVQCPGYEPMSGPTTDNHLAAVKDLYDYLVELGLLPYNLMEQAKKAWKKKNRHRLKRNSRKRHLSKEEVVKLYQGTTHPDRKVIIGIGTKTGPRGSEIGRLRVDPPYLDPELKWMRVPRAKGNNGKRKGNDYLVIDNELRRVLAPYLDWRRNKMRKIFGDELAHPYMIIDWHGDPLPKGKEANSINKKLQEDAIRLGLQRPDASKAEKVTSHCLRRYFSNACMKNGLYGTRLEILRGDKPKRRNEEDYGEFTDADIRQWYEQYAPIIGF